MFAGILTRANMIAVTPLIQGIGVIAVSVLSFFSGTHYPTSEMDLDCNQTTLSNETEVILKAIYPLRQELNSTSCQVNSSYVNLTSQIRKTEETLRENVETEFRLSMSTLMDFKTEVESKIQHIEEEVTVVKDTTNKLVTDVTLLKQDTVKLKDYQELIKTKLDEVLTQSEMKFLEQKELIEAMKHATSGLTTDTELIKSNQNKMKTELLGKIDGLGDDIFASIQQIINKPKKGNCPNESSHESEYVMYLSLMVNTLAIIMMTAVYMKKSDGKQSQFVAQDDQLGNGRPEVMLNNLHRPNGPSNYQLYLVTFSEASKDEANHLFKSMNVRLPEYRVISDSTEVRHVPRSERYMVVIPYDGRNSIVEDMDDTHGSKKRKTVENLQKRGGELLIIYLDNDISSESPHGEDLFSSQLDRAHTHPLLAPLVRKDRFISAHRGCLTEHQKQHIKRWIRSN